jgi:glycosyltransferase involved in cell wall biosynthesis
MKVSVVATVLNEADTITSLLGSLLHQTKNPTEIIVVDGGSSDGTYEVLKDIEEKNKKVRIYKSMTNIAQGRNLAIDKAKYKVIAQIDGGCIASPDWLEKIVKPLQDKKIGVSAGFYKMVTENLIQEASAPFLGVTPERFDPRSFLPSGRSIAFRKSVWEEVGGYSENLQWGEDTLFNYHILKKGIKIARVPNATVSWSPPNTLPEVFNKFYMYAIGDAQTGIWWHPGKNLCTHNIKIMSIFARYLIGLSALVLSIFSLFFLYILILGFILYTSWSLYKMRNEVKNQFSLMLVPLIQIISDVAVMSGFLSGSLRSPKPRLPNSRYAAN